MANSGSVKKFLYLMVFGFGTVLFMASCSQDNSEASAGNDDSNKSAAAKSSETSNEEANPAGSETSAKDTKNDDLNSGESADVGDTQNSEKVSSTSTRSATTAPKSPTTNKKSPTTSSESATTSKRTLTSKKSTTTSKRPTTTKPKLSTTTAPKSNLTPEQDAARYLIGRFELSDADAKCIVRFTGPAAAKQLNELGGISREAGRCLSENGHKGIAREQGLELSGKEAKCWFLELDALATKVDSIESLSVISLFASDKCLSDEAKAQLLDLDVKTLRCVWPPTMANAKLVRGGMSLDDLAESPIARANLKTMEACGV